MSTPTQPRRAWRRWAAPLAGVIAAAALLALPPVRAAADQLLQVFRVQAVVFVPVSQERLDQLSELNFDEKRLFIAEPKVIDEPAAPRAAASIDEASALAGFRVEEPATLPDGATRTQLEVSDASAAELQVDVAAARELIALAGVSDVSLPDALGERPIRIDMAPAVMQRYESSAATISLMQARSPQVALPEGVDLSQLGRVALRVLGMAPEQADALASQIDWSSTLLVPFPADLNTVRQVSINGAPGMLVSGGRRAQNSSVLYWQRGEQIYVLQIESALSAGEVIDLAVRTAESLR